ncbi:MAG: bifunctional lysylphosphatidylglycerol synthetase/lysine--tRNA ligase LysX [Candidatus Nanopelagicales bacterium]
MTSAVVVPPIEELKQERRYVPGTGWESKVPRIASWVCYLTAFLSLVTAIIPATRPYLRWLRALVELVFLAGPPNLAWAVLMIILASAIGKRKRAAWGMIVFLEVLEFFFLIAAWIVFPTAFPNVLVPLLIDLTVIGILLLSRREFFAISQRGNGWRAALTFAVGLVISFLIGWAVLGLVGTPQEQARRAPVVFDGFFEALGRAPAYAGVGGGKRVFALVTGVLGSATLIATAFVFFRPRRKDRALSGEDEINVRIALETWGERDSLAYFSTRRDKSAIWSASGKAVVTYRVVLGVSVASADPVGDPEAWPLAIEAWLEEAHRHAWAPAVMGASRQGAEAYRRAGLGAIELGDEAIIEFRNFNLDGRSMRVVRQAVSRIERAGYTARVRRHSDISKEEMNEAIDAADRWRDTDNERGFSMALGRLGDPLDGRCVLVETFDAEGNLEALLSFSPWGKTGLSLDLMRRSRDSENGVMEFMVASLIAAGPLIGADRVSLNFAVMRAIFADGERIGAGPVIRSTRWLLVFASRWFQLESLYRSNAKYDPDWFPRYLMFENTGDLPRVGLASAAAEGFISLPKPSSWFRRRGPAQSPLRQACAASPVALMAAYEQTHTRELELARAELAADPYADLPEQERIRRNKLAAMRERGIDPYATSFQRSTSIGTIRSQFGELEADVKTGQQVAIAGRLMLNRVSGKICFATIRDWSGEIQVMLTLAESGEQALHDWKNDVDLGDIVGVKGEVITSKRGELSVLASSFVITSKCLVPLPDKHKGLSDPEARVRQRYVDLIVNNEARDMLAMRSDMVRSIRESLWQRDYLEVETPMMQRVHGGANARPFVTHINAYDMQLYMRIAPELYLKRLLVGGAERVFEMNRNFRNEGADSTHNPEFTSLEMYDAYGDYDTMRVLTRQLILDAAIAVHGEPVVWRPRAGSYDMSEGYDVVDISGDWPVITLHDAVSEKVGEPVTPDTEMDTLIRLCEKAHIARDPSWGPSQVVLEMYEHLCEATTTTPVFYSDFPTEVSPLTRKKPGEPRLAERWDLVAWGAELGTAYTELIDPIDQRDRLTAQSMLAAAGDAEAMEVDEDFLRALEYGMPPAGGQGMGIDRLIMFLTGRNIRETVLFPLTRPDQQ